MLRQIAALYGIEKISEDEFKRDEEQLQKFTPDKKLPALPTVLPSTPRPGNYPPLEAPAR